MDQETLARDLGRVFGFAVRTGTKRYRGKKGIVRYFPDYRKQVDVCGPHYDIYTRDTGELASVGLEFSLVFRLDDLTVSGHNTPQYIRRTVRRWFPEFTPIYTGTPEGAHGPHT